MTRTCTKCKNEIPDNEELEPVPCCFGCCVYCWAVWMELGVMVIIVMWFDM